MKKIITLVLLAGLAAGCGFVFQDIGAPQLEVLEYGMTKQDVISKLGSPQKAGTVIIQGQEYESLGVPSS